MTGRQGGHDENGQSADPHRTTGQVDEVEGDRQADEHPGAGVAGEPGGDQDGRARGDGGGRPPPRRSAVGQENPEQGPGDGDEDNEADEVDDPEPGVEDLVDHGGSHHLAERQSAAVGALDGDGQSGRHHRGDQGGPEEPPGAGIATTVRPDGEQEEGAAHQNEQRPKGQEPDDSEHQADGAAPGAGRQEPGRLGGAGRRGGGSSGTDLEGEGAVDGMGVSRDDPPGDDIAPWTEVVGDVDGNGMAVAVGVIGAALVDPLAAGVEHPHGAELDLDILAEMHHRRAGRLRQHGVGGRVGGLEHGMGEGRRRPPGDADHHHGRDQPESPHAGRARGRLRRPAMVAG